MKVFFFLFFFFVFFFCMEHKNAANMNSPLPISAAFQSSIRTYTTKGQFMYL